MGEGLMQFVSFVGTKVQTIPSGTKKGAILKLTKDVLPAQNPTEATVIWSQPELSEITLPATPLPPGQQTNWQSSLGIDQAIARSIAGVVPITQDIVGIVNLKEHDYIYRETEGRVYGLRRLVQADCSGYSDRTGVAPVGNPYSALNGTGNTGLWNSSYQWLEFSFPSQNCWKVILKHSNGDNSSSRSASIGGMAMSINGTAGTWTSIWTSSSATGWSAVTRARYGEAQCRTMIDDWRICISNPTPPVCTNGRVLAVGDRFRLNSAQGYSTLVQYGGVDPSSGAWFAQTVTSLEVFDSRPIAGSLAPIQSTAVKLLESQLAERIEAVRSEAVERATEWLYVADLVERDALGTKAIDKLVRVGDTGVGSWAVFRGIGTFTDNPDDPPAITWHLEFDQQSSGQISNAVLTQVAGLVNNLAAAMETIQILSNRLAVLESKPEEIVRSPDLPDFSKEWKLWIQSSLDYAAWTLTMTEFSRVDPESAMPMIVRTESLRPPVHTQAVPVGAEWKTRLPGGGELQYGTGRNSSLATFTFPAGVYSEVAWWYVNAEGLLISGTLRAEQISSESTAHGMGRADAPYSAVAVQVEIFRPNLPKISYSFPI